ncbi:MAG: DUF2971 domain-containing protein, partial [Terracidiphilus sp.]
MEEQETQQTEEEPKPTLLYHYTDQNGLHGIIENKCIRATHSQFLNDLSEYRIVFDALLKKIKIERTDNWAVLQSWFLRARQMKGIFVSSFSHEKKDDSLAMWRGYSAATGGYSIGFDRLVLNDIAKEHLSSDKKCWVELGKCSYDDPEESSLAERLERIVESAWKESLEKISASASNDLLKNAIRSMPVNIMEYVKLAAFAKHQAFEEEKEWRIVIIVEEGPRSKRIIFRQGKSMVVPYMEFSWKDSGLPNPIRRVVVGPTPNKDE